MPGNVKPIFSRVAAEGHDNLITANTTRDLTSGTSYLIFTGDATNGSRVDKVVIVPRGTNVATVLRLWLNNGGSLGTASNNSLVKEITCPTTTASEVAALAQIEQALDLPIPPGYRLYATIGTGVAAGLQVTAVGGHY